jgi:phenylacetate-CoA ligase
LGESQYWPAADLANGQQVQLTNLLEWAAEKVAHYQDAEWARSAAVEIRRTPSAFWDIWQTLPILTKPELRSEGARLRARDVPNEHLPLDTVVTSGSTGISVEVASTAVTRLIWTALTLREMHWGRRDFKKRLGAIRYLGEPDRDPKGYFDSSWPKLVSRFHQTGPFGIIHVGHQVDVLANWLKKFDPHYLITHPSLAEALVQELGGRSGKPSSLQEIVFVAEPVSAALEARLVDEWRVRCSEYYSANEVGYIAFRCPEEGKLHVQSESVLVEIIDQAGKPCAPGEAGRVVVTALHNLATPLIRYELGDYATVGEPCACGRHLPVIDRVLGRVRNLVHTPDGRRHWPVDLGKFRTMSAIRQFQYVQSGPETIELRVVLNAPLTAEEEARAEVLVREALGYPFEVEITPVAEIARGPSGKYEEFLSLLPTDEAPR